MRWVQRVDLACDADGSRTEWDVGRSSALADCGGYYHVYYASRDSNSQPSPPDSAIYGWSDPGGYNGVHIVAGDGGGH